MMNRFLYCICALALTCCACNKTPRRSTAVGSPLPAVRFDADSAWSYLEAQCAFGPRVPGTESHAHCVDWFCAAFDRWGVTYDLQETTAKAYDGRVIPVRNLTAHIHPESNRRVLLLAHYDCRPWSDNDADEANWHTAVQGANDGASGVSVLLEIARQLASNDSLSIGVDILLTDAEDMGTPQFEHRADEESWCLGTQCWARDQKTKGYRPMYGILLDMVGAPDATFCREYFSDRYASGIVTKVWGTAAQLGYQSTFVNDQGGAVTDDHLFINRLLGVPCIDIIHCDRTSGSFPSTWHTINDTPEHCSASTLAVVGRTLLSTLLQE